jgi:branched-chain amino acid transport system substrate-binding protein
MKKIIILIVAVLVVVGVVVSKRGGSGEEGTIKIGGAFALTGDIAPYGEADRDGALLAVEEINSKGGINGKKLELVSEDTRSNSKDTVSAFLKLKNIDKTKYFLVSFADTYPGTESLVGKDEVMISPDAGIEVMNGEVFHPNVFGTWYRTEPKTELVIKHMVENGKKKIYLLVGNDGYYKTVVDYTKKLAQKYNVEVVGIDYFGGSADMKSILPKVKSSGADSVFFGIIDNSVYISFLKNKHNLLDKMFIYTDENATSYMTPEYISYLENMYFYSNVLPKQEFLDNYKKRFGHEPQITASVSYDSLYMIAEVIKNNPKDINKYMRSRIFDSVSYGKVSFDEIGGIVSDTKYFVLKQIKKGIAVDIMQ